MYENCQEITVSVPNTHCKAGYCNNQQKVKKCDGNIFNLRCKYKDLSRCNPEIINNTIRKYLNLLSKISKTYPILIN